MISLPVIPKVFLPKSYGYHAAPVHAQLQGKQD
jgi:hypothetical protein